MLKILSYFVLYNHTPHIILPITTFNTSIKPFVSLTKFNIINNKRYDEFVEKYKNHEYYDQVSVLMSEWANGGDLLDYFRKNYKDMKLLHWKIIFFQILSVLAVIHNKYPDFRHNDMKANNILVHKIECHRNNKFKYKINGQKFVVPNIGFQIKLWDFDFACIPSLVPNTKVEAKWTDKINIKPNKNQYYDIHYFFNTLTKKGFLPDLLTSENVATEVQDFIKRVVPDEYSSGDGVTDRGRLLLDVEHVCADDLLKNDAFFEAFRTK
jgi:serine/threonine protein kinase